VQGRLVYFQVFAHAELVTRADRQHQRTIKPSAKRGDILDRRGRVLATSVDAPTIYAVPSAISDERQVVAALCKALGDCKPRERQDLIERLGKKRDFAYVRRQVTPEEAKRVADLKLDGIGFLTESRRYYPNKELAAHLVGFVGVDNAGLGGIESAYDSQIRGKEGQILVQTDARRQAFSRFERPSTPGSTLELTIDEFLQHIAEKELRRAVVENRAQAGSVVIMNPRTGEILAMANEPTFNPNEYREYTEQERRNRAVQNLYEPGSTFKVVTASGAIEERVVPPDAQIDASGGQIRIGSRVVTDTHDYGVLSLTDVMVHSSNVGAIRLGFKLGTDRLSDYVQRFGFGKPVSPDFPAESPGIVWDRAKWTESALASVSMGYQVGVTPIQMAAAVSAVANGGRYMEPRAVRAMYRSDRRIDVRPKELRRPINANTAASLTTIMEQVVERGTGTPAQVPGYTIAGKTGTANKLANGRYSSDTYASFVGFVPSRDPAVTIIVMVDSPRGPHGHFGGPVSAPVFKRIAEATLRYLGIPPTINPDPPVLIPREDSAHPRVDVSAAVEEPLVVDLVADGPPGTAPDLRGMSAREATRKLVQLGLVARLSGDGVVVAQSCTPGEAISEGETCRLTLARTRIRREDTRREDTRREDTRREEEAAQP
jgi:cell division protein FtsI (penicillin-binding protein 3)